MLKYKCLYLSSCCCFTFFFFFMFWGEFSFSLMVCHNPAHEQLRTFLVKQFCIFLQFNCYQVNLHILKNKSPPKLYFKKCTKSTNRPAKVTRHFLLVRISVTKSCKFVNRIFVSEIRFTNLHPVPFWMCNAILW